MSIYCDIVTLLVSIYRDCIFLISPSTSCQPGWCLAAGLRTNIGIIAPPVVILFQLYLVLFALL